jgi:hypothetical protein
MKPFMNKGWEHYNKMQAILFSTAARGSHIYQPAQAPLAIVCDNEEPINLSKASTAATSMAAAISTASNLAVAATETLPLMDVDNNSRVPSMTPLVPPPSLPSGSSSAGKHTHSVMSLNSVRVSFSCSPALIRRGSGQRHSQKLRAVSLPRTTSDPSWDQVTGNADYRLRLRLI